jgi:hypothetical protein
MIQGPHFGGPLTLSPPNIGISLAATAFKDVVNIFFNKGFTILPD